MKKRGGRGKQFFLNEKPGGGGWGKSDPALNSGS